MRTLDKVTIKNFSRDIKAPYPIYADKWNEAVEVLEDNFSEIEDSLDYISGLNATTGATSSLSDTIKTVVNLTSANLLGMNAAPVVVIASPGAGYAINLKSCVAIFDSTVTAYANGGVIYLSYNNTTPITNNVAATFLTGGDKVFKLNSLAAAGGTNMLVNTALTITNDTAPFITGTGVARLLIEYEIVETGL